MSRSVGTGWLVALVALAPWPAHAHLVSTGLGPFYDGIGHFALGIESWLPLLALALLAGLQGAAHARRVLVGAPLGWLLAVVMTRVLGSGANMAGTVLYLIPALVMLIVGVLAALAPRLRIAVLTGLAIVIGALLGWLDGAGLSGRDEAVRLLAGNLTALLLTLILFLGMAIALARTPDWRRIAARALSSWVAAAGLLLLGWQLR